MDHRIAPKNVFSHANGHAVSDNGGGSGPRCPTASPWMCATPGTEFVPNGQAYPDLGLFEVHPPCPKSATLRVLRRKCLTHVVDHLHLHFSRIEPKIFLAVIGSTKTAKTGFLVFWSKRRPLAALQQNLKSGQKLRNPLFTRLKYLWNRIFGGRVWTCHEACGSTWDLQLAPHIRPPPTHPCISPSRSPRGIARRLAAVTVRQ